MSGPARVLALTAALAVLVPAVAVAAPTRATLPTRGVLVPNKSLGGIRLGDTQQRVLERWGANYELCTICDERTWLYMVDDRNLVGAAVSFRGSRVSSVFTLGAPEGWRTSRGVMLLEDMKKVESTYGVLTWTTCTGYAALSMAPRSGVVTSIFTDGQVIYGFALTRAADPVCR